MEGDDGATLRSFVADLGLTYPILWDEGGAVYQDYGVLRDVPFAIFPQDWIVGSDGRVAYVNNAYEPDEMVHVIERELALSRSAQ